MGTLSPREPFFCHKRLHKTLQNDFKNMPNCTLCLQSLLQKMNLPLKLRFCFHVIVDKSGMNMSQKLRSPWLVCLPCESVGKWTLQTCTCTDPNFSSRINFTNYWQPLRGIIQTFTLSFSPRQAFQELLREIWLITTGPFYSSKPAAN